MPLSERNYVLGSFRGAINTINKAVTFIMIYWLIYCNFKSLCVQWVPHQTSLESHYSVIKHNSCAVLCSLSLHHVKHFVSPLWNLVGLSVHKDHWVAFPFALFLFVVVVQVLVTSYSLWGSLTFPICPANYLPNSLPATLLWDHYTLKWFPVAFQIMHAFMSVVF